MPGLKCKKCNGNHLTIKCGKNKKSENKKSPNTIKRNIVHKKLTSVRMTNIPDDLTICELKELLVEWGKIGKVNFNKSEYNRSVFIDFYNDYEAEHFVKALHKTPFDNYILDVSLCN